MSKTRKRFQSESRVQASSQEHNQGWNDNQSRRRKTRRTQVIKKIVEMPTMMTWKHSIGVNGETLDQCESVVELRWPRQWWFSGSWDGEGGMCEGVGIAVSQLQWLFPQSKQDEVGRHKQRRRAVSRNSLPAGGERVEETQQHRRRALTSSHPLHLLKQSCFWFRKPWPRVSRHNRPLKLSSIDVKKAHLCGDVLRELHVEVPPKANELPEPCTARVTRRLRVNGSGQKRWIQFGSSLVWAIQHFYIARHLMHRLWCTETTS